MSIAGEVSTKFLFPWSGGGVFFSRDLSVGYDLSEYTNLTFRARGEPRTLAIMFFSRTSQQRPATMNVELTEEWETFTVPLAKVRGLAIDELYGFAITAGRPKGPFTIEVDDVAFD